MEEWRYIFAIGAIAYIFPALIFALYGSGEIQKWNTSKTEEEQREQEIEKTAT
jgi:MFS transporter, ACS family, solute carrier family 17 (sodium-dependent inorganic phosphate cotransporter), other